MLRIHQYAARQSTCFARQLVTLLCAAMLMSTAHAASGEQALAQVDALTNEAAAAFDTYAYKKGMQKLTAAVSAAHRGGVHHHRKLAATYLMMGIGAISGQQDDYRGLHYFVQAVRRDAQLAIPSKLATPQLLEVFKQAQQVAKDNAATPTTAALADTKPTLASTGSKPAIATTARGLEHTPVDDVKVGMPLILKAQLGADVGAKRVILFFRPSGKANFKSMPMTAQNNAYRGEIAAAEIGHKYLHYYIEAQDQRGRMVAKSGSAKSPNVVLVNSAK